MKTLEINSTRIWSLWETCQQAYLRNGRKLQLPPNTDPTKTYQWRYLNAMMQKFDEWEFDNDMIEKFVDIAVRHAKEVGILCKGLAALHQKNLLEICYKTLQQEVDTSNQRLESLRVIKRWLQQQIGKKDLFRTLLKRTNVDSAPNIILWYQANKISELYMALSKSCYNALLTLEKSGSDDLILLPKANHLYWIYHDFVMNKCDESQAKHILENDWRNLCR